MKHIGHTENLRILKVHIQTYTNTNKITKDQTEIFETNTIGDFLRHKCCLYSPTLTIPSHHHHLGPGGGIIPPGISRAPSAFSFARVCAFWYSITLLCLKYFTCITTHQSHPDQDTTHNLSRVRQETYPTRSTCPFKLFALCLALLFCQPPIRNAVDDIMLVQACEEAVPTLPALLTLTAVRCYRRSICGNLGRWKRRRGAEESHCVR